MMAATYVVKAGDMLKESIPLSSFTDGKYVVAIHGPNGFFREFTGDKNDPALEIACAYQAGKSSGSELTGNVEVQIKSKDGSKTYAVEITDNSYMGSPVRKNIGPGDSSNVTLLDLSKQHGWYDFSIKVPELDSFERRYAGHVDTGKSSYTDPLMGGVLHSA
jgi:phospholipase C